MMKTKKKICENCRTGREAFEIDNQLPMCPHITNWENNKCCFYEPIEPEKDDLLNKILKNLKFKL